MDKVRITIEAPPSITKQDLARYIKRACISWRLKYNHLPNICMLSEGRKPIKEELDFDIFIVTKLPRHRKIKYVRHI